MDNNYCPKKKILLSTFRDKVEKSHSNFKKSLDNSGDLFVDVSSVPCITGSLLVLNDNYRGK